jgi:YD repeat-containing protein
MPPSAALRLTIRLAPAVLAALLWAGTAQAQTTCTTRTDCLIANIHPDDGPPVVTFGPLPSTVSSPDLEVTIRFADETGLQQSSATYAISGGSFVGGPVWSWHREYTSAIVKRKVTLAAGTNTISATICDNRGACTTGSVQVSYVAPPPPVQRSAPELTAQYLAENRNLALCDGCSEAVLTYTAPAHVSLDQPRAVTLFYSSHQASPRGYVEVEAVDRSIETPDSMFIQVSEARPDGTFVALTLDSGTLWMFYHPRSGANRLAASFPADHLPTGMHTFRVRVESRWNGDPTGRAATVMVRVPVVNEAASHFGAGWTVAGVERVHAQSDGALVTDGAGGVQWFSKLGCSTANDCTYAAPAGETSTLAMISGSWRREHRDGRVTHYHPTGYVSLRSDRLGNQSVYQYDSSLTRLVALTDPAGRTWQLGYDANARLYSLQDPAGRASHFTYTGSNLTAVYGADSRYALRPTYQQGTARLSGWTDARGGLWSIAYDSVSRRLAQVRAPEVGGVRLTTTIRSREASVLPLLGTGKRTNPARTVPPDSVRVVVTSPLGVRTSLAANARGQATEVATARDTARAVYDAAGRLTHSTDGKGNSVSYTFEAAFPHRLTRVSGFGPEGNSTMTYDYGVYDQVSRMGPYHPHKNLPQYHVTLDTRGLPASVRLDTTVLATYQHDTRGRVTVATDAGQHTTTFAYQSTGAQNLQSMTANGVTTEFRYDGAGRTVRTVRAGIASDSASFDVLNRMTSVRDAAGGVTQFG